MSVLYFGCQLRYLKRNEYDEGRIFDFLNLLEVKVQKIIEKNKKLEEELDKKSQSITHKCK